MSMQRAAATLHSKAIGSVPSQLFGGSSLTSYQRRSSICFAEHKRFVM
jgi:hypothetical protein